ncbi:MAG: YitT family protein [Acutalibacteraceae bacterium]|nr:YitT family protein [Clostridia bacterium]MEE3403503.1 YitT family protein [Acutalibacteraceae bacterium]
MKQWNSKNAFKLLLDFVGIAVGAVIAAFAIEEFLVPCTILDGGVVGIGIIVNYLTGWPLGILTVVLNTPFLLIGSRKMGRMFIVKAVYAMVIFSVFLEIFAPMQNVTSENLLAVSFGGVILGIGAGLVIRFGGCLDGTETVAILLNKKFKLPVGQTVLFFNVLIFSAVGIIMGLDRAMYSLLTYFITSKVLDIVESGLEKTKAAMIITDDAQEIAGQIYSRLGRTVTIMEGAGLVSGKKVVLYCVLTRFEIHELKEIIKNIDASAFIAISDVSEIIGTHVKKAGRIPQEVAAKLQENSPPVPPPTEE